MQRHYNEAFFQAQRQRSIQSARQVVPIVLDLAHPESVIDIGCGVGAWLAAFQEQGIQDFQGVDGDYVNLDLLMIPREAFLPYDLTAPFRSERKYDLAVCLEVGEHLPEASAERLVESLTLLSPVVLFSAAVPHQGGVHHVNEQWQGYWQNLFAARGYLAIDCIRGRIWNNKEVEWFYAQNTLLYVRGDALPRYPKLQQALQEGSPMPASVVHPGMWLGMIYNSEPENMRVGQAGKLFMSSLKYAIRRRIAPRNASSLP